MGFAGRKGLMWLGLEQVAGADVRTDDSVPANRRLLAGLIIVACLAVMAVHWPALSSKALLFDDGSYFVNNTLVSNPGWLSARRFLTEVLKPSTVDGYYQPLAMISLMFDRALGARPDNLMPLHRTSLLLHTTNTAMVILLLYLLFGRVWVAVAAGLLFGVHPMTVEVIAWVGERKTVLATFFSLASLITYVMYTRRGSRMLYLGVMFTYILALMSKPTSTPLPALMLLMDFWPLRRLTWRTVAEKIPLFLIGGVSAVVTIISQEQAGDTYKPADWYGPSGILLIICHNIVFYLHKIVWPTKLGPHYVFPDPLILSDPRILVGVIGTAILLPILTVSLRWTRAVFTSWLSFFVVIFPSLGVIGFTIVIASDKFTYLPSVGLLMGLTALLIRIQIRGKRAIRIVTVGVILIALAGESLATRRYLRHWRSTENICRLMLRMAPKSGYVHALFAGELETQGHLDKAFEHYRLALKYYPGYPLAVNNMGTIMVNSGRFDDAIDLYRAALQAPGDSALIHHNLAYAYAQKGDYESACENYRQALRLEPDRLDSLIDLAVVLKKQGRIDEALASWQEALRIDDDNADVHFNLGLTLIEQQRFEQAAGHFREVQRARLDSYKACYYLGLVYSQQGQLSLSIAQFDKALQISPEYIQARLGLAQVWRKSNKLPQAIEQYRTILEYQQEHKSALYNLSWILATAKDDAIRDGAAALTHARRLCELTQYRGVGALDALAAAYAAGGDFTQAIEHARKALEIADLQARAQLADSIRKRLELYRSNRPYIEVRISQIDP